MCTVYKLKYGVATENSGITHTRGCNEQTIVFFRYSEVT